MSKLLPIHLILLTALGASPAAVPEPPLTAERAAAAALADNLELTAARFVVQQAQGRLVQAGLRPNPEWDMGLARETSFKLDGESRFTTGFKQRFPITGRLAKAKAVARVDVALALAEVRNQERLLIGEVFNRSRELLVLREQLQANQQIQETIRKAVDVSERRLKVAEVSAADVNLAKLELQKASLGRAALLIQEETALVELNRLLGREPGEPLTIAGVMGGELAWTASDGVAQRAVDRRPDRQQAALAVDRGAAEVRLARAEKWEDWTVGFDYSRDRSVFDAPIGNKVDNFLGLSISIPLPLWNKNQGRVAEAQASQQRARAELDALELRIAAEVRTAEARLRRLKDTLRQYDEETVKLAAANVALLQKGYADGLVGITPLIQAQQQLTELRQSYLEIVAQFLRAKTDWETATASSPLLK